MPTSACSRAGCGDRGEDSRRAPGPAVGRTPMILFVNASSKRAGNTTAMAERLLDGTGYETLHLVD